MSFDRELLKRLDEAKQSGKYFITISYLDRQNKLQHTYSTNEYYTNDLIPSLNAVKDMVEKDEKETQSR